MIRLQFRWKFLPFNAFMRRNLPPKISSSFFYLAICAEFSFLTRKINARQKSLEAGAYYSVSILLRIIRVEIFRLAVR